MSKKIIKSKSPNNKMKKNANKLLNENEKEIDIDIVYTDINDKLNLKFRNQHEEIKNELNDLKNKLKECTNNMKKLESAHRHDVKQIYKSKNKRKTSNKQTGFIKERIIPENLAKFLHIESGTKLTGPKITKLVWEELKKRNLQYKNDKRVFRTNDEVSSVFDVKKSVNKSTSHKDKDGFNFCNIQKHISYALNQ